MLSLPNALPSKPFQIIKGLDKEKFGFDPISTASPVRIMQRILSLKMAFHPLSNFHWVGFLKMKNGIIFYS